ncbi:MAG: MMPL family transporter, partial [Actinomycetales bacterium]|nr:MMPL family transporter [Actinomycetales bacterium]
SNKLLTGQLVDELSKLDGVDKVTSYYTLGQPESLKSDDGKAVYFFVNLNDKVTHAKAASTISDEFSGKYGSAKVYIAGFAAVTSELNHSIERDIITAESIAVPLTVILLIFVFGSAVASGLPLIVGGLAILGSFFFVWISTQVTDTSIFSMNLITGMGLGLGIDYSLLIVNRYREERKRGRLVAEAVEATVLTAGRTVVFSGLTVALVLVAMMFFPQYFLRSFASAGFAVVLLCVLGAIIALPAAIRLLGDGVNKGKVLRGDLSPKDHGAWANIARFVMKRPVPVLIASVLALGGLVSLGNGVQFGQVDDRILPANNRVVVANDIARTRFSGREASPVEIMVKGASHDQLLEYTSQLSKLTDIVRVQSTLGITQKGQLDDGYAPMFAAYEGSAHQRIQAIHNIEPRSPEGYDLTERVRAIPHAGFEVLVGGSAAIYTDSQQGIERNLPIAALWVVVATLLLLFLFTGSVLLPIKAVLLNFASLSATIGFLTWVFMGGHLKWLFGEFTVTGTIDASTMVLIGVVAFGLSMDYELFLISRIKEQHDAGRGTTESVAVGLQRSGRIITAAALVLALSFAGFITSGVTIIKMMGVGIAFAILLDATLIRAFLVPALMRLFGNLNWWAPKWLRKLHQRAGLDH